MQMSSFTSIKYMFGITVNGIFEFDYITYTWPAARNVGSGMYIRSIYDFLHETIMYTYTSVVGGYIDQPVHLVYRPHARTLFYSEYPFKLLLYQPPNKRTNSHRYTIATYVADPYMFAPENIVSIAYELFDLWSPVYCKLSDICNKREYIDALIEISNGIINENSDVLVFDITNKDIIMKPTFRSLMYIKDNSLDSTYDKLPIGYMKINFDTSSAVIQARVPFTDSNFVLVKPINTINLHDYPQFNPNAVINGSIIPGINKIYAIDIYHERRKVIEYILVDDNDIIKYIVHANYSCVGQPTFKEVIQDVEKEKTPFACYKNGLPIEEYINMDNNNIEIKP